MTTSQVPLGRPTAEPERKGADSDASWRTSRHGWDALIVAVLAVATFLAHSVSYVLSAPFWVDEAWVAVSTKVNLRAVPHVTAVTPIGWTLLLRTMVIGGEQRYRLLPLIFSALAVAAAYLLVRTVPWHSVWWARLAATLAGIAVLLAPASLLRNDLKQYTADAFVTLVVLLLVARLERAPSRRALVALGATCACAFLISAVALFIGVAAFAAVIAASLIRRSPRQTVEATVAGLATGLLLAALFKGLYAPHVQTSLTDYWKDYYLPVSSGWEASLDYLATGGGRMADNLGMGPMLVAILLVLAGVITLARAHRPALACAAPLLLIEMMVLSAAKKYPLFDIRTSHFLEVTFAVYAAIGVAGLGTLIARRQAVVATLVIALLAGLFVNNVHADLRAHSIPAEDVRTPTAYVAANRRPSDIVIVSALASEGFSYYWPFGRPVWHPNPATATAFQTTFPDQPRIVVAADRNSEGIKAAMVEAIALARQTPGARIWLIRSHLNAHEQQLWLSAVAGYGVRVTGVITCSLMVLAPLAPRVRTDPRELTMSVFGAGC